MAFTMKAPSARVASSRNSTVCKATSIRGFNLATASVLSAGLLTAAPALADVSFNVADGANVSSPVHLEFTVKGMTVKPAAEGVIPNTGHFHVLVDAPAPAEGEAIPFDAAHLHYGKGQTSADIELAPGKHTLVLQFANALHESYGSAYASTVTVNVK